MASVTLPATTQPWQQRRSVRASYVLILLVLAACAFADSFVALAELARATGALAGHRAFTLPLMLDGLTLAGTLFAVTRFGPGQGSPAYGYALIALGTLASLAGNVAHAPAAMPARIIAGAPPLILLLTFEAAAISFRRRPGLAPAAPTALTAGTAPDQAGRAPDQAGRAPEPAVPAPEVAEPAPEPTGAAPERGGAAPELPAPRIRAARIYAEHIAAGTPLTGARLAELAGISPRYSRTLLAEFRAQPGQQPEHHPEHQPAQANGHRPDADQRLDGIQEWSP